MNNYRLQHYLRSTVSRFPERIAIREAEKSITYEELDKQSDFIAWKLNSIGHKQREVVGVLLPKSIDAVSAFIGVLKSGGTYIPLDSVYSPLERILHILQIGKVNFVITSTEEWDKITQYSSGEKKEPLENIQVVFIDKTLTEDTLSRKMIDRKLDEEITDDDIAYILYTSGSTGTPKGVTITHLNALTFVRWAIDYFNPEPGTVFSCHAPFHFDLSVFDLYVSLSTGGCVVLVPYEISSNPKKLIEWIAVNKINYWYSVPSIWVAILNYAKIDPEQLNSLKKILFAGEVFPPKFLRELMKHLPEASYYNLYGPTETNVCTVYHVRDIEQVTDSPVPIGKACANTEIVILNENNRPASIGEKGALFAKGSIVTKGYYMDEELTKSAFIKSPLPNHNGALLYKTGDIVKINSDGDYEYIGRSDFMVKVSGFRVELQEIEYVLYENPDIDEAVVIAYTNEQHGNTSLGAIIKLKDGSNLTILEIKKMISAKLPYYMIPEVIFKLNGIPKNINGKFDRNKSKELFLEKLKGEYL